MSFDLNDILREISKKRDTMMSQYNRVLPTNELFFERSEKASYLGFGKGTTVYDSCVVLGKVSVGNNVWIGPYTLLDGFHEHLSVGDGTTINSGVQIYTHDSTDRTLSGGKAELKLGPVKIGSHTVIGSMSIILPGVTVGSHCLIQANSLVLKDVPNFAIVAGFPGKIIGEIIIHKDGSVERKYHKN